MKRKLKHAKLSLVCMHRETVRPSPVREPKLVSLSSDALRNLGLSKEDADDASFLQV